MLIDPIGFALESFDAGGRFRRTEDGLPIDTAGRLDFNQGALMGSFSDAVQLASLLSDSASVSDCVQRRWQVSALPGTSPASPSPLEDYQRESVKLRWQQGSLQALVEAIVVDDAFRYAHGCGARPPFPI